MLSTFHRPKKNQTSASLLKTKLLPSLSVSLWNPDRFLAVWNITGTPVMFKVEFFDLPGEIYRSGKHFNVTKKKYIFLCSFIEANRFDFSNSKYSQNQLLIWSFLTQKHSLDGQTKLCSTISLPAVQNTVECNPVTSSFLSPSKENPECIFSIFPSRVFFVFWM